MEKKEILKTFLDKGFQLDLSVLNFLSQNSNLIKPFLQFLISQKEKPIVITDDYIELFLSQRLEVKVVKPQIKKKEKVTVQDVLSYFTNRFEFFKSILSRRMELFNILSINKISSKSKKFSLIGLVREIEKDRKKVTIEDTTGSVEVLVEDEKNLRYLTLDEVVGLLCVKGGEEIICKKIVWPDLPLKRRVKKTKEEIICVFVSNFNGKGAEAINREIKKLGKNCILFLINSSKFPSQFQKIEIELKNEFSWVYVQDITILLLDEAFLRKYMEEFGDNPLNTLLYLLRKRHLNPEFNSTIYEEDPFLIKTIPDIAVIVSSSQSGAMNYKGVTLISLPKFIIKPIGWSINLRTREYLKLNFS